MLLEHKVAVIYGAGGPIGGAVARAFAREGARVFLGGRTEPRLQKLAGDIRSTGGDADVVTVDALDEQSVNACADSVAEKAGAIDISVNLINLRDVQKPLMDITVDEFLQPILTATRAHLITGRAAARHMIPHGSGVIMAFGGSGPQTLPGMGGFKIALDAMEGLRRQWACELGEHGVRVVTLKTGGIPETLPNPFPGREEIITGIEQGTLLKRAATLEDVGHVAAFVASDQARTIAGTEVNISCGGLMD